MFALIRHTKISLKKAPSWGLLCLKVFSCLFSEKFYAVLWRETSHLAITKPSSLGVGVDKKIRLALSKRKVNSLLIDGSKPYRYCEPFCRFLARHANEEELEWAFEQGVQFGVRTPTGATFLSDAVTNNNTDALLWAKHKKFNFNILGQYQAPLLAFVMTINTPFHPYVSLFMEAGASLDFRGNLGLTARQVIEQNPAWRAQWEKNMLQEQLNCHATLPHAKRVLRKM